MKNTLEQVRNYLSDELYFRGFKNFTFTIESVEEDANYDFMFDMKFEPFEALMQFKLNALMEITGDDEPLMHADNNSIVLTLTITRTKLYKIPF